MKLYLLTAATTKTPDEIREIEGWLTTASGGAASIVALMVNRHAPPGVVLCSVVEPSPETLPSLPLPISSQESSMPDTPKDNDT